MNGPYSEAVDISEDGIVVGWTGTTSSSNDARGFVYNNGELTIIDPPPNGLSTTAKFITPSGVVGLHCRIQYPDGIGTLARAGLWSFGTFTLLEPLPGYRTSFVSGTAENGLLVGSSGAPVTGGTSFVSCIWRFGIPANLNALLPVGSRLYMDGSFAVNEGGQILSQTSDGFVVLSPVASPQGDINLDCLVGVPDRLSVISHWGGSESPPDVTGDGRIDAADLLFVISNWGSTS